MHTVMVAFWWAGCLYGGFKVLQRCSCFPHASIFDVQHVAVNSFCAPGAVIFRRHSCQKAWWHDVCYNSLIYMFTHVGPCERHEVCVFVCVCAQMSGSLCNTIVHCHLQSAAALAAPPPTLTHTNPNRSKHCTPSNPLKSLFTDDLVWRQQAAGLGEGERVRKRWGVRVVEAVRRSGSGRLQGLLLSAIVKELGGIIGLLSSMRSMHF